MVDTLRLNPLAFPRNPYHHLVKHYQDGQLKRGRLNDPELDARLTLELLRDQYSAFGRANETKPELLARLALADHRGRFRTGLRYPFSRPCGGQPRPSDAEARDAIEKLLQEKRLHDHRREILANPGNRLGAGLRPGLAVGRRGQFGHAALGAPPVPRGGYPGPAPAGHPLRDPGCPWCREQHDARKELTRWFGFTDFLPEPAGADGRPLQQTIVEAAMRGEHLLAILPTGTGKSLCYQIPALSRYDKTGALTVVISPLVALMADQVAGLEAHGITSCAAINGLLSMPERADVLDGCDWATWGFSSSRRSSSATAPCARPWPSARSAPGCSTRPTASPNGGMISGPITVMSAVSSGNRPGTGRSRPCCA